MVSSIRKCLGAVLLWFAASAGAHAASVPLDTTGFLSGVSGVSLPFTVSSAGSYTVTLTDLGAVSSGFFSPFSILGVQISTSTTTISTLPTPGTLSLSLAAGSYFAGVGGLVGSGGLLPLGHFGIKVAEVASVPLPAALPLLGSALCMGAVVARRRVGTSA